MTSYFNSLRRQFAQKGLLVKLIIINVAVFFIIGLLRIVATLFDLDSLYTPSIVEVSPDLHVLIRHPWTVFTYMFVHYGILHLFFNMIVLYWSGQLFLNYFNPKQLGSMYILGGLAGAALFILAFNTVPYYLKMGYPPMIGASAGVTAILFAAAFYNPQQKVNLLLIGSVKVIYIALVIFALDFISLADKANPGGHVAHIGGAMAGYLYAVLYRRGTDITRWITRIIDGIANLFKPRQKKKTKMRVKTKREEDYEFNQRKRNDTEEIDRILDKIKASGYGSLNSEEKKRLFDASQK